MSEVFLALGVPLAALPVGDAVARGLEGGLVLAPSGPGLCDLDHDEEYRDALLAADLNLTDSAFLVLLRTLRGHRRVTRTSGLRYLEAMLREPAVREPGATFWVMPTPNAMARNLAWLREQGHPVDEDACYVAPSYPRRGCVEDEALLGIIETRRPRHVFVCVGGGVQEKLGAFLNRRLSYPAGIHCIGAAIAFLSGDQVRIPLWADRLWIGWLLRCIRDPRVFVPRYLKAFKLAYLVLRYDEKAPPITPRSA